MKIYPQIYRLLRNFWPGGQRTQQVLEELERTQWLSRDELRALELSKLQKLVTHAYQHVPYYRKKYSAVGFEPGDFKRIEDFQALPLLTRDEINTHREEMVADNFLVEDIFLNETGGSTGHPMRFYQDDDFWWANQANNFRVLRWYGKKEGQKEAWFWGAPQDMPLWNWKQRMRAKIMQTRYLNAFTMTEEKMRSFAEMLVEWDPYMYRGYASVLTLFAEFVQKEGYLLRPHFIESTSERLYQPQRELLEKVFGCPVADHYSSRELGTMAFQSPCGKMLSLSDMRYMEIIAHGQVVEPGTMGEIAMTSLTQYSFPFIRYKNGDMAIMEAGQSPCGRNFPIIKDLLGRTNDFLVSADGKFVHSEFFAYTFRVKPEVARYQIYQPDREHLEVRLTLRQKVSKEWLAAAKAEVQNRFGAGTAVSLKVVDDFELTKSGKHRYIISDVKPDFAE